MVFDYIKSTVQTVNNSCRKKIARFRGLLKFKNIVSNKLHYQLYILATPLNVTV